MADIMSDPMMLILLFVSMIGIAIVVISTVMRERSSSSRPPQNQQKYMAPFPQAAMIPAAPPPPSPPPAARNNGDEYSQWINKINRLLVELKSSPLMINEAVCGSCGRSLKNPNGTLNLGSRTTYYKGYPVREVFCTNCGAAILEQEPKVKPPTSALRQEVEALAPPRGSGFDIVVQRREEPAPAKVEERVVNEPSPEAPAGDEAGEVPPSLAKLSDKAVRRLLMTCGGCPHFEDDRCKESRFSGRNYRISKMNKICSWWSEERAFTVYKTGRFIVNDKYADAYAEEG
jgi:hypothetical protein